MGTNAQQVVIGDDFSFTSESALRLAAELACRSPANVLHVIAVLDAHHASTTSTEAAEALLWDRLRAAFAGLTALGEVQVSVHAVAGRPAEEILRYAESVGADLILVGSHSRRGTERALLGSVSEAVMRAAGCAVMVVRPKTYADVDLARVVHFDAPIGKYDRPHRYGYPDGDSLHRSKDWPML